IYFSACPYAPGVPPGPRPLGCPLLAGGVGAPAGRLPGAASDGPGQADRGGCRWRRAAFLLVSCVVRDAAGHGSDRNVAGMGPTGGRAIALRLRKRNKKVAVHPCPEHLGVQDTKGREGPCPP